MILIAIFSFLGAVAALVYTVNLSSNGNYWSVATAIAFLGLLVLGGWSWNEVFLAPKTIENVKAVQIDTVITTCKDVSDTTYVIKYKI